MILIKVTKKKHEIFPCPISSIVQLTQFPTPENIEFIYAQVYICLIDAKGEKEGEYDDA